MKVIVAADEALIPPAYRLDRSRARDGAREGVPSGRPMAPAPIRADIQHHSDAPYRPHDTADAHEDEEIVPPRASEGGQQGGEYNRDREREREREGGEAGGRRRRRRRRGGRGGDQPFQGGHGEGSPQNEALARVPDMSAAEMEADAPAPLVPGIDAIPEPQGDGQGTDEQGRRRRRRGRRGGRRRHGEGGPQDGAPAFEHGGHPVAPAFAPEAVPSAPPVVIGPGHDLPPDSPLAAPRIEGPGDAHDWPWNRRNERFPEDPRDGAPAARTEQFPEDRSHITAPPPMAPPPVAEPVTAQPAPMTAVQDAAPRQQEAAPQPEPVPDEPKGPPRKGWWKRLTE
jgi:ribonuclease E